MKIGKGTIVAVLDGNDGANSFDEIGIVLQVDDSRIDCFWVKTKSININRSGDQLVALAQVPVSQIDEVADGIARDPSGVLCLYLSQVATSLARLGARGREPHKAPSSGLLVAE